MLVGILLALLRFILLAVAGWSGAIVVAWLGIALHGLIYSFMMVAGRMFLDKRVPEVMRGQAQALYQLLVACFAGIVGAFLCGWLYEMQVDGTQTNWTLYWTWLALMTTVPLAYFAVGVIKQPSKVS